MNIEHFPGLTPYEESYRAMQDFTDTRSPDTADRIWLLEHPPVYTLGLAGDRKHLLNTGDIPVYHVDRGGQATYHGPGQLVIYVLLDLKRRGWHIKAFVYRLEQVIIDFLAARGLSGTRREKAPGVYVAGRKLAALGLRVRRGCCYHGLSLNVNMDLSPFQGINPCGHAGLEVTQLYDLGISDNITQVSTLLTPLINYKL